MFCLKSQADVRVYLIKATWLKYVGVFYRLPGPNSNRFHDALLSKSRLLSKQFTVSNKKAIVVVIEAACSAAFTQDFPKRMAFYFRDRTAVKY